jgi:TIR domain
LAYLYDVFVSYRRRSPVYDWVHVHFFPLLRGHLDALGPRDIDVFVDTTIETGDAWPEALKAALRRSRVLVPVLSANYFRSDWCMAEFETIRERERLSGFRTTDNPHGLILPVRFSDGTFFSSDAQAIQYFDMSAWCVSAPGFAASETFVPFELAVAEFAQQVVDRLDDAPVWRDDWPLLTPSGAPPAAIGLPRL